jgi:hypothetical protein
MGRRSTLLAQHPWRILGALAALLVAVGSAVGSGALFTTQTVNPNNTFSSGILHMTNDHAGTAILQIANMVPGDSQTGTVTIGNDGTVDGSNWTLTQTPGAETPGTDPGDTSSHGTLSSRLHLTITNTTTSQNVYDGTLAGFTSASLSAVPHGGSNSYSFTVSFPPSANDNAFEGGSVDETYSWAATAGS